MRGSTGRSTRCSTFPRCSPTSRRRRWRRRSPSITPGGKLTKSFFTNSGTEANETAILTARCYTGNTEIVALRHSYHGRSGHGDVGSPGRARGGWDRRRPGVVHAHNAYCYRCPFGLTYPDCEVRCAAGYGRPDPHRHRRTRSRASSREPMQGVGGFITPPKEYFQIVEKIVRNHGGIFISDEVQTGWGRTGDKWFGIEHWGVTPDIITSAKGLGNGTPIGLTVAKPEVADSVQGPHHFDVRRQPGDDHRRPRRLSISSKSRTSWRTAPRRAPTFARGWRSCRRSTRSSAMCAAWG